MPVRLILVEPGFVCSNHLSMPDRFLPDHLLLCLLSFYAPIRLSTITFCCFLNAFLVKQTIKKLDSARFKTNISVFALVKFYQPVFAPI